VTLALRVAGVLGVALALAAAVGLRPSPAPDASADRSTVVVPLTLPEFVRQAALGRGETLSGLLSRLGVASAEAHEWLEEARRLMDVRALPVGLLAEARSDVHGTVRSLRLAPDWSAEVVLERTARGVTGRREERPVERESVVVAGQVHSSLFQAVANAGESDALALALADIFQWDIDFHREVQRGDSFSVLVERRRVDGATVGYGPILAASYQAGARRFVAVRFLTEGTPGYYDERGRPLKKQFLRAPLKLSRITSGYSSSRLHPVLGQRMPHWGVDYAAPEGTPVMVTADGTVTFQGWKGGGGNTVEVRHAGGYTTAYLHLSRFARGLAPGQRVAQGQVIGYVGSTGLATGPHVDYRVTRNGTYLNPLRLGQEPAPPLKEQDRPAFAARAAALLALLEAPGVLPPSQLAALEDPSPHGG
jgi:murein DD-endopeptidase MepM/ murein hydrolase activator NlpD